MFPRNPSMELESRHSDLPLEIATRLPVGVGHHVALDRSNFQRAAAVGIGHRCFLNRSDIVPPSSGKTPQHIGLEENE